MATQRPLISSATGQFQRLPTSDTLELSTLGTGTPDNTTFLRGDGTWATPTSEATSLALSSVTAATATNTILNGDNAQNWQWALTSIVKSGLTLSESTASINGGSGQVLLDITTVSGSTATPLRVVAGGVEAIRVGVDGNVGLGDAAPSERLSVVGNTHVTGNAVVGGTVTAEVVTGNMLPTNGAFGHRNKIINGKMEIAQRGTSFTDPNDVYTLDRWKVNVDNLTGAAWSVTQSTAAQDAIDHGNLLRYSVTTVGSMTFADIRQPIEDVRTLQGKQVTVSFLLRYGAVGKTIAARLEQNFGSGGSAQVITTVFTATGSTDIGFARYSGTVTLPSVAGKTIGAGNSLALVLRLTAPNAGDFVDVAHIQLEEGPVATPFEHRTIGTELALCQRYGERISGALSGYAASSTVARCGYQLRVAKRAVPTLTLGITGTSYVNNAGGNPLVTSYSLLGYSSVNSIGVDFGVASGLTLGQGVTVNATDMLFADAEL